MVKLAHISEWASAMPRRERQARLTWDVQGSYMSEDASQARAVLEARGLDTSHIKAWPGYSWGETACLLAWGRPSRPVWYRGRWIF